MSLPPEVERWIGETLGMSPGSLRVRPLVRGVNAEVLLVACDAGKWVLKRYRQGCDTDRHFEAWCERLRSVPRHVNVEQLAGGRRVDGAAYAHTLYVDWRGQPDRSQRLASALALRADADAFLEEAESLAAGGRLRPAAARWMSMNARSVRIMRQVLAGDLQPWGENPWLQELGRKRFPAGMPAESHVVRALRADPEPDVFVPFGWAARLAF